MFTGEYRVRRRKVALGGRSKDRAAVQNTETTLETARRLREERQKYRIETEASTRIGAFVRSRLVAKRQKDRIRRIWIEKNGEFGEKLSRNVDDIAHALRQCIFFAGNNQEDALRFSRMCERVCEVLLVQWLEQVERTGGVPAQCIQAITLCIRYLHRIDTILFPERHYEIETKGEETIASNFGKFVSQCLGFENVVYRQAHDAIFRSLNQSKIITCAVQLLQLTASDAQYAIDTKTSTSLAGLSRNFLLKSFQIEQCDPQLISLLTIPDIWCKGDMATLMSPYWNALIETITIYGCPIIISKCSPSTLVVFKNLLYMARKNVSFPAPFLLLLSSLLKELSDPEISGWTWASAKDNLEDGQMAGHLTLLISVLTENVTKLKEVCDMVPTDFGGFCALVSLLSRLISLCQNIQVLIRPIISLAFTSNFLEKLWLLLQYQIHELEADTDGKDVRNTVLVLSSVHTLRLQIINDLEFYHGKDLSGAFSLDEMVVYLKNFLVDIINDKKLTVAAIEVGNVPYADVLLFSRVSDHLDKLHEQNGRYRVIEDKSFHIKFIVDEVFFKELEGDSQTNLIVLHCPYLIPFHERVKIFRSFRDKDREQSYSSLPPAVRMNPFLSSHAVTIRRKYILEDGYSKLDHLAQELKRVIRIQFVNELGEEEAGVDGGGLFKDFLESLVTVAFDTQYGFFCANPENKLYPHPSSSSVSPDHLNYFRFFGRMVGKALYEGILVDVPFAEFFLRKLRGKKNDFNDLPSLDKELHSNLCFLREYDGNLEDLGLYFAIEKNNFGKIEVQNLVPNGKDVPITNDNVIKYIHLVANFKLNVQLQAQVHAFMQGFLDLIPQDWVRMFNDSELQELLSGSEKGFDLNDMKVNMYYSGGYSESHPAIQMFWRTVSNFTAKEKAALLKFVTSCSRPPLLGFRYLEPKFCIQKVSNEKNMSRLPTAATCMNLLKLPAYESEAEMGEKIRYAINAGAGFDLS